jgi:H+/Cl- antiporter ClcA
MKRFTLGKETLSNRSFYQLILYAIVLGTVVGLATAVFLLIEHWLTELIWEEIPHRLGEFSLYALVVCTVGGLLVGLCQHFLGDYPKPMREALEDVRTQGGFDVAHVPHGVVSSLVSLSFGGALGPEAALIGLAGGLGTWVARRIKVSARQAHALAYFSVSGALGAFFRSPFGSAALPLESPEEDELPSAWVMIPGVFAGVAGLAVTLLLTGDMLRVTYDYLPYESPRNGTDLLIAVPLGLLGAVLGWLYLQFHHHLTRWLQPLGRRKIMRGLLGGVVLGLLATFSPLVLFSGQAGLNELFINGAEIGAGILVLIGIAKVLALGACMSTGWKGGEFFPIMFAGAAVGMGIAYLIPAVNPMVGLATVMAAATAAMLRKPLATILIIVLFMPGTLIIPIAVGAFVGAAVSISNPLENH